MIEFLSLSSIEYTSTQTYHPLAEELLQTHCLGYMASRALMNLSINRSMQIEVT